MIELKLTKEQIKNIIGTFNYCEYDGIDFTQEDIELLEILKKALDK